MAFFWISVSSVKLFVFKACFNLSLMGKSENLSPENTSAFFSSGTLSSIATAGLTVFSLTFTSAFFSAVCSFLTFFSPTYSSISSSLASGFSTLFSFLTFFSLTTGAGTCSLSLSLSSCSRGTTSKSSFLTLETLSFLGLLKRVES